MSFLLFSVITPVSAANVDLTNSESLKLARSVDPQGRRTTGVLVKLDLVDAGTNANDIPTGRTYPLKLGFIGVVNQSQRDIDTEKPLDAVLERNSPPTRLIETSHVGRALSTRTLNQASSISETLTRGTFHEPVVLGFREPYSDTRRESMPRCTHGTGQQELNSFSE